MKRIVLLHQMCAAVLLLCPLAAQAANSAAENQAGADRVAAALAECFPNSDLAIRFQDGTVWVKGELCSPSQISQAIAKAKTIPGVNLVNSELTSQGTNQGGLIVPMGGQGKDISSVRQIPSKSSPKPVRPTIVTVQAANQSPEPALPVAFLQRKSQQAYTMVAPAESNGYAVTSAPREFQAQQTMPGQYCQPNLPSHAWPSYAAYPNYGQVSYPKQHSRGAWPYIGPFYPYPKVPLEWRKVAMEFHDGYWWLDFDDGSAKGPFSPLFRQPNNMMMHR